MSVSGLRSAEPTAPGQRIEILDLLRGFALFGMFIVHFHDHSTDPGGVDDVVRTIIWRLIESKAHGTFAVLFGAGFAIQLRRAEERGAPFAAIYFRRLAVLALFGFAAHAFFGFNVLLGYAMWGVLLLAIRNWSSTALLVTAALSAISVALFQLVLMWLWQLTANADAVAAALLAQQNAATDVRAALDAARTQSSYLVLLAARLRHMAWFYRQPFFIMPNVTLALFIAGLLLIRHRVFEQPHAHRRLLAGMTAFGAASWLLDDWLLPEGFPYLGLLRDQWLTFTYIGAALLIAASRPNLAWLAPVARAGRMALTNYLLQIVTIDLLFSGYALGLPPLRPLVGFPIAVTCFAIELVISTLWLQRFVFGPAEWLWRSATYGRLQPLRRMPAPVTVGQPDGGHDVSRA